MPAIEMPKLWQKAEKSLCVQGFFDSRFEYADLACGYPKLCAVLLVLEAWFAYEQLVQLKLLRRKPGMPTSLQQRFAVGELRQLPQFMRRFVFRLLRDAAGY